MDRAHFTCDRSYIDIIQVKVLTRYILFRNTNIILINIDQVYLTSILDIVVDQQLLCVHIIIFHIHLANPMLNDFGALPHYTRLTPLIKRSIASGTVTNTQDHFPHIMLCCRWRKEIESIYQHLEFLVSSWCIGTYCSYNSSLLNLLLFTRLVILLNYGSYYLDSMSLSPSQEILCMMHKYYSSHFRNSMYIASYVTSMI